MYDRADLPPIPMGDWCAPFDRPVDHVSGSFGRLPKAQSDRQRRAYFGQISHIDSQVGRLLVTLQRTGLIHNTIFVFASDHGELLGDHAMFRKTSSLEGSAKLALLASAPRRFELQRGRFCDLPTTHMDLMPTLLDLAGLEVPDSVEGRSLVPALRGEQDPDDWRPYVHGEHARPGSELGGNQFLAGRKEKYTWFTRTGEEWLFDLEEDPQETVNLVGKPEATERLDLWRGRMVEELSRRPQDGLTDGEKLTPGRDLPNVRPELLEPFYDNEGRPRPRSEFPRYRHYDEPPFNGRAWPRSG